MKMSLRKFPKIDEFFSSKKAEDLLSASLSSDKLFVWGSLICITFVFLSSLFLLLVYRGLAPQVPLFYSLPWGEKMLADRVWLWLLPIVSLTVFSLNLFLAGKLARDLAILSRILVWTATFVSLILFITLFKIVTS